MLSFCWFWEQKKKKQWNYLSFLGNYIENQRNINPNVNSLWTFRLHWIIQCQFFFQRVQLYNACAAWAMCRAGFEMLDVYPLSASFPNGTDRSYDPYDSVHYKDSVFKPAEEILMEYFWPWNDGNNIWRQKTAYQMSSMHADIMRSRIRKHKFEWKGRDCLCNICCRIHQSNGYWSRVQN